MIVPSGARTLVRLADHPPLTNSRGTSTSGSIGPTTSPFSKNFFRSSERSFGDQFGTRKDVRNVPPFFSSNRSADVSFFSMPSNLQSIPGSPRRSTWLSSRHSSRWRSKLALESSSWSKMKVTDKAAADRHDVSADCSCDGRDESGRSPRMRATSFTGPSTTGTYTTTSPGTKPSLCSR